jgi:2'-5' RNA ligase
MEMGLVKDSIPVAGRTAGPGQADYLLVIYPRGDLVDRLLEEQQQFNAEYFTAGSCGGSPGDGRGQHPLQGQHPPASPAESLRRPPEGQQRLARNKPHITLAAFQAGEETEDTVIRWIQRICHQHKSFDIALNNYSGIPPHTPKPPGAACPSGRSLADCREYANFSSQHIPGNIYLRVQDPQPLRELMQQLRAIDEFIRSSGWPPVNMTGRPYLSIAGGLTEKVYNKAMPDYSRKTFHGIFRVDELVLLKRRHSFDPCKTVNIFRLSPE